MKKLLSILTVIVSIGIWGQDEAPDFLPQITPPSPVAAALGNYGNIPVGEFTGAVNINIPILTYKTKNLEMPISLYYGSNGIKVDEFGSNVGLGWNINMGGVITRTVRDEDDFHSRGFVYPPNDMSGGITNPLAMEFFQKGSQYGIDTEKDYYSFNVGGYSGGFVFGDEGIVFTKPQRIFIDQSFNDNQEVNFTVTTPEGIKYFFKERETTVFRTVGGGHQPPSIHVTAWYVTEIHHPKGDRMFLEYNDDQKSYTNSLSQTLIYSNPRIQGDCSDDGPILYQKSPTLSSIKSHTMRVFGKKITKISSNSNTNGYLQIDYNSSGSDRPSLISSIRHLKSSGASVDECFFEYNTTNNNRDFLRQLTFKDSSKNFQLEYFQQNDMPTRLTKAQDHWGYYNGKYSSNIVPIDIPTPGIENANYNGADKSPNWNFTKIGMLNKIIYPSKGYTEFEYEPNSYWGEREIPAQTSTASLYVETLLNFHVEDKTTINLISDQEVKIEAFGGFNTNCDENMNLGPNRHRIDLKVLCLDCDNGDPVQNIYYLNSFGERVYISSPSFNSSTINNKVFFSGKKEKTYEISILANFNCINGAAIITYETTDLEIVNENVETGGIRIKSVKDISLITNDEIYKRYYYGKFASNNLSLLNKSSGNRGMEPNYWDLQTIQKSCGGGLKLTNQVISSGSLIPLFDSGRSNIYYPFVTISHGGDNFENGGIAKEFILNRDYWGNNLIGHDIKSAPWTNSGWDNGFEKKSTIIKKSDNNSLVTVQESENTYINDERDDDVDISYAIRKDFNLVRQGDVTHTCTSEDIALGPTLHCGWNCEAVHNHIYWWFEPLNYCSASGANNVQTCMNNPCHQKPIGHILIYPNRIENLSIMEYKTISHWSYLSETKTTTFDENGENPILTETKYFYDSPDHLQLTGQSFTNSDGKTHITAYQYPPDLIGVEQTPYMDDLTDANRISEPVITETFLKEGVHSEKTSEQHIKYGNSSDTGNLLLPVEVHTSIGDNNINISNIEHRKVTYTKYASNGNILEYKLENGITVSIIWGYNEQYPIAKVEGAFFTELSSYLTTLQGASNNGTLTVASFDSLRNDLSTALVTGYVYEPLVGVKVISHPNRSTEYYEYDAFGRLKEVKNSQGEVIRKMEYNYRPQP